jgi:hypothetical protein
MNPSPAPSLPDLIEQLCAASAEPDPIAIAQALMRHPAVQRAGANPPSLVAGALAAAWANVRGEGARRAERVAAARRYAEGSGAGATAAERGARAFLRLAAEGAPGGGDRLAEKATAAALAVMKALGESACRHRDAHVAILASARAAREHLGVDLPARGPSCELSTTNRSCIGGGCPFNR